MKNDKVDVCIPMAVSGRDLTPEELDSYDAVVSNAARKSDDAWFSAQRGKNYRLRRAIKGEMPATCWRAGKLRYVLVAQLEPGMPGFDALVALCEPGARKRYAAGFDVKPRGYGQKRLARLHRTLHQVWETRP